MRILSFSSSFPSKAKPTEGIFVYHRVAEIAKEMPLEVVHPIPVCPIVGQIHSRTPFARQESIGSLTVYHRRFRYLPRLLKRFDAAFYAAGIYPWLREYCKSKRPDLLDGHFMWPDGVAVSYLANRMGLPYTITLRGTIIPRYKIRCFRWRMARALQGAAAVISVSKEMADIAVELGTSPEKVHVIPNGVDLDLFKPMPREEARAKLGLERDGRLIVCVASLKPPKGIEDVLAAMKELPDRDVRLIVIGGQADRGAYLRRLQSITGTYGLGGRVSFAGVQPQGRLVIYFNAADVSVLASHSEGCPNVVLESLACGTPVVATPVGAVPSLIRPPVNGLLTTVHSTHSLAVCLKQAMTCQWNRDAICESIGGQTWSSAARRVQTVLSQVTQPR